MPRRTKHVIHPRDAQRGFALLLVLGLLAVAALIIGTMISRQQNEATWSPVTETKTQLDEVQRALAAYERTEHRLPMPAPRTSDGGAELHVEALSALGGSENDPAGYSLPDTAIKHFTEGYPSVLLPGGIVMASSDPTHFKNIMIVGAVPTETLGISREAAEDQTGHLLTYAVTFEMVNRFQYTTAEGAIDLKDANGQVMASKLAYVVLSHGKNAKGAWSAKNRFQGRDCSGAMSSGSGSAPPTAGNAPENNDYANCAYTNASFVINDVSLVRGAEYFDDQLLRGSKDRVAISKNRSCIGPINVTWKDDLCPSCTCQGTIPAPGLVSINTHGTPKRIDLQDSTLSDVGQASFECNDGSTMVVAGSNTCTRPCILPWGGTLENGDSVQAYSIASASCGQTCPTPQTRMCINGTLSGSGAYPSCNPAGGGCTPSGCALPWGGTIADGATVNAYAVSSVSCNAACPAPTVRACDNGILTGMGDFPTCTVAACGSCALPWGGTIANGASVQAYASDNVPCGSSCALTTRTCNNGVLSGAGNHENCKVEACGGCTLPWGGTIDNGASVQAYAAATVACRDTCTPQTRTCSNGVLSGMGDYAACSAACSCTPWQRACEPWITSNRERMCEAAGGVLRMRNCAIESDGGHPPAYACSGEARCDYTCCQ